MDERSTTKEDGRQDSKNKTSRRDKSLGPINERKEKWAQDTDSEGGDEIGEKNRISQDSATRGGEWKTNTERHMKNEPNSERLLEYGNEVWCCGGWLDAKNIRNINSGGTNVRSVPDNSPIMRSQKGKRYQYFRGRSDMGTKD